MSTYPSKTVEWVVCERTNRWASALRIALSNGEQRFRIRELRRTAELEGEFAERPEAIVALEVRRDNVAELLSWLAAARKRHRQARAIALVDRSIDSHMAGVLDALVEAGAEAIATSPRQLASVIALAALHAENAGKADGNLSPVDIAWTSLPWQSP